MIIGGYGAGDRCVPHCIESIIGRQGRIVLAAVRVRVNSDVDHGLIAERRDAVIANLVKKRIRAGKASGRRVGESAIRVDQHAAMGRRGYRSSIHNQIIPVGIKIIDEQIGLNRNAGEGFADIVVGNRLLVIRGVFDDLNPDRGLVAEGRALVIADLVGKPVGSGIAGGRRIGKGAIGVKDQLAVGGRNDRRSIHDQGIAVRVRVVGQKVAADRLIDHSVGNIVDSQRRPVGKGEGDEHHPKTVDDAHAFGSGDRPGEKFRKLAGNVGVMVHPDGVAARSEKKFAAILPEIDGGTGHIGHHFFNSGIRIERSDGRAGTIDQIEKKAFVALEVTAVEPDFCLDLVGAGERDHDRTDQTMKFHFPLIGAHTDRHWHGKIDDLPEQRTEHRKN